MARSATAGLGALVASPLSVDEYAEDVFARTVSLIVRDDSSDYAWRIDAEWTDSDGRVELLEALSAMFGEPAPIVGLRRLRTRGDIRERRRPDADAAPVRPERRWPRAGLGALAGVSRAGCPLRVE